MTVYYGHEFHVEYKNGNVFIKGPSKGRKNQLTIVLGETDFNRVIKEITK